jgi:hypothetical protein
MLAVEGIVKPTRMARKNAVIHLYSKCLAVGNELVTAHGLEPPISEIVPRSKVPPCRGQEWGDV